MEQSKFAKLFMNGSSQAVRLPREFKFSGSRVRIRRYGAGVLLEPEHFDLNEWFACLHDGSDFEIARDQPITPDTRLKFH